jgi:hypothetical protein
VILERESDRFRVPERAVFGPLRGSARRFPDRWAHLCRLSGRRHCKKSRQAAQVDHRHRKRKEEAHFFDPAPLHLPQDAVLLGITEDGLDEFSGELAQAVARVARGAAIDAAFAVGGVLRDMRGDVDLTAAGNEGLAVS